MSTIATGFEAMGRAIPEDRMTAAYRAVKQMVPDARNDEALELVGKVAHALEEDEPYLALRLATGGAAFALQESSAPQRDAAESDYPRLTLDVTGGYRLVAHLLT